MTAGNGSTHPAADETIQAAPGFLGSHQGLQSALHPLPRHGDRADVPARPAHRQGAEHHFADRRLRQSHPGAQRRRAAVPSRHLPARRVRHQPRAAHRAGDQRHAGDKDVAQRIKDAGIKRVSISLDGSDAATHDTFRGIPGAFEPPFTACGTCSSWASRCRSTRRSPATTRTSCPTCWTLARTPGRRCAAHLPAGSGRLRRGYRRRADGCSRRVRADAELVLRPVAERRHRAEGHLRAALLPRGAPASRCRQGWPVAKCLRRSQHHPPTEIGPTEMTMPGSTGISLKPGGGPPVGHTGHPGGHPERHERHDQGLPGRNRRLLHLA